MKWCRLRKVPILSLSLMILMKTNGLLTAPGYPQEVLLRSLMRFSIIRLIEDSA